MDVNTGEVLALVSMPAYDPNEFSKGIKSGYYAELLKNQRSPLMNKAIAGQYPPGSTFKMMTGLAGLKAGTFHAESRVFCNGTFYLGSEALHLLEGRRAWLGKHGGSAGAFLRRVLLYLRA